MKSKSRTNLVVVSFVFFAAIVVVGISLYLSGSLSGKTANSKACGSGYAKHSIVIKQDKPYPTLTYARKCDKLTITNLDNKARLMAFGKHDHHIEIDGVEQRYLNQGENFSVILAETGTYTIHDHYQDEVQAKFVVSN